MQNSSLLEVPSRRCPGFRILGTFVSHYALLVPLMVPDVAIDNPKCWHDTLPEVGTVSGLHNRPLGWQVCPTQSDSNVAAGSLNPVEGANCSPLISRHVPTQGWIFLRFTFFFKVMHFHKKIAPEKIVVQCMKSTPEIHILLSLPIFDRVNQIKLNQVVIGGHE